MTWDEYMKFLDEYWEMFGPPRAKEKIEYKNIKI